MPQSDRGVNVHSISSEGAEYILVEEMILTHLLSTYCVPGTGNMMVEKGPALPPGLVLPPVLSQCLSPLPHPYFIHKHGCTFILLPFSVPQLWIGATGVVSETSMPGVQNLALLPTSCVTWVNYYPSLILSFLIFKMKVIINFLLGSGESEMWYMWFGTVFSTL